MGAGNSAVGNYGAAGQQYLGGMAQGASTIGSGLNMQLSGLGNVLNSQTQMAVNAADNSFLGNAGGLLGGVAGMATAFPGAGWVKALGGLGG